MKNRYYASEPLKKEMIKRIAMSNTECVSKIKKSKRLLLVAAIWFLIVSAIALMIGETSSTVLGAFAIIVPIVLIAASSQMKKNALSDAGFPYNKRTREYIEFFEDSIEFGYCDKESKFSENMCVYTIFKEDLTYVKETGDILTIVGIGKFITYDDFPSKRINHAKSQRQFYSDTEFNILLDYKEKDEIIKQAKEMKER